MLKTKNKIIIKCLKIQIKNVKLKKMQNNDIFLDMGAKCNIKKVKKQFHV